MVFIETVDESSLRCHMKHLLFSKGKHPTYNASLSISCCSVFAFFQIGGLDVDSLFSNIESVHQLSAKLLSLLEEATTDVEPAMQVIGMFTPLSVYNATGSNISIASLCFGFIFLTHQTSQEIYQC